MENKSVRFPGFRGGRSRKTANENRTGISREPQVKTVRWDVERKVDVRTAIDNARLLTKLSVIGGILTIVLLLLPTLFCGVVYDKFVSSDLFALGVIPYTLAALFAFAAMVYGMLGTSAAMENEEKQLLEKRSDTHALNVEEDVRFTAGRSFQNYARYAPYVLAVLGALIIGGILLGFYRYWGARITPPTGVNSVRGTVLSGLMAGLSLFSGAFFIGQSRQPSFRWLRAFGAWLLTGFGLMFVSMAVAIFSPNSVTLDALFSKIAVGIFIVLGIEFALSFIIEFYRPRTMKEVRPVFESRFLSFFTEPGGVMRNIAAALDYQFGFKVSGTWLYSFLERSFFPVVLCWGLIFWGFTMIHEVGPNQVGVKEELGKVVSKGLLSPGIYWTLPWPFGQIKRFSCTELKQVVIGDLINPFGAKAEKKPDAKSLPAQVVLWTNPHGSDVNNFIVAVDPGKQSVLTQKRKNTFGKAVKKEDKASNAASIAFIRMLIPIQYRIRPDGVMDYAYYNANPVDTLVRIGQQAVTEYMASTSVMDIMSLQRSDAQKILRNRIQKLADLHRLGIEVTKVMILDSHPPVEKVAPAFQDVIGAREERESMILKAEAYAARTLPESRAQALEITTGAKSYSFRTTTVAKAEAARFNTQLGTYRIMPRMFRLKAYLGFLENDCKDIRKFIVAAGLDNEIYELNFQTKERLDLVDVDSSLLSGN